LVFIDETWVKTNREPLRGWGPRQQRLPARIPHGHGKTLTFVAALRHDRIDAPWVIDGPINGELFSVYVDKVLAPTVAQGEIVVLDNLGGHKGKPARAAIRAAGALRESHISFHFPTHANGVEAGQAESYGLWACGFVSVAFVSIPSA
jgi:hypothetical protein